MQGKLSQNSHSFGDTDSVLAVGDVVVAVDSCIDPGGTAAVASSTFGRCLRASAATRTPGQSDTQPEATSSSHVLYLTGARCVLGLSSTPICAAARENAAHTSSAGMEAIYLLGTWVQGKHAPGKPQAL